MAKRLILPQGCNPERYIQVPGSKIAVIDAQGCNGLTLEATQRELARLPVQVTPPREFFRFRNAVIEAYEDKKPLCTAAGDPVTVEAMESLYDSLTRNCSVHLNARFIKGRGFLGLDIVTSRYIVQSKGDQIRVHIEETCSPLEKCIRKDNVFVDSRSCNSQGMPTKRARIQSYSPRTTMLLLGSPQPDSVAGFGAGSGWACLFCIGGLRYSVASLGVFYYAEGVAKK